MVNSGHALNGAEPTPIHIHSQTERFDLLPIALWGGIVLNELATTGNTDVMRACLDSYHSCGCGLNHTQGIALAATSIHTPIMQRLIFITCSGVAPTPAIARSQI